MRHGVLILAHKYPGHLNDLIQCFDEDFSFFIHLDKRNKFSDADVNTLKRTHGVQFVSQELAINWGGVNHLKGILLLAKEALRYNDLDYFHVISGQDYPIKSTGFIKKYFEDHPEDYMDHFEVMNSKWKLEWMKRISFYGFYGIFNAKSYFGKKIINGIIVLQKKLNFSRALPKMKLYGGSGWWSLSRQSVSYVMDYTQRHPALLRRLRFTFCADEVYFQTILMNSSLKDRMINNNLRFIDWTHRNGNFPANLDESDFDALANSDKIFARKFEFPISENLKDSIKKILLK